MSDLWYVLLIAGAMVMMCSFALSALFASAFRCDDNLRLQARIVLFGAFVACVGLGLLIYQRL